ncbi:HEXXH motif domain-containing protein [Actinoplanes sp. L3-i22]|uniref:HEXXH motif domain-containing protein n=1 Tax=Actinoplanes sp. L3-i22 TaxID=2836373 RepID=UPI001C798303|nr:HEXXH motif domain-containing protein [Actinoplanes sp. L3-i22]BCY13278.1 HEXXH motif domain-containing protein [Actinoplanes sp. L3-i22]
MTTTYHRLPERLLTDLAAGNGGPEACRALAQAQLSKHLLLISDLLRRWTGPAAEHDRIIAALDAARSADPAAADRVLGSPQVGAWVTIVNRAAAQGIAAPADLAHLSSVAAVTCAAAGVDTEMIIQTRDGAVSLPGLGSLTVGDRAAVTLTITNGVPAVGSSMAAPGNDKWQPVRVLRAESRGIGIEVALDDLDLFRHGYHAPPAPRLPADEFARWQDLFAEAWQLLTDHLPDRAAELAAGLRVLVPLRDDGRSSRSATIRHLFGVFGLTRPATAADLVVTMVHEFQHAKLSGLVGLEELTDPADTGRYFAPWRTDPRPLAGLVQGVYAFAGVADAWRALSAADGVADLAVQEFADARLFVDKSLAEVESSGALTAAGERFTGELRRFADSLLAVQLPDPVTSESDRRYAAIHQRWSAANARA